MEVAIYLDEVMAKRTPPPAYIKYATPVPAPGTGTGSRYPDEFPFSMAVEENEEVVEEEYEV